jgi:uncharacterized membrane protein
MLPNPLHPAIVHFPVVLAFLLPLFVAGALWAIRRGVDARRAWLLPVVGAAALGLSAWAAVETGESTGERVERVVSEQVVEEHEEMAEAFLTASAALAGVALLGLVGGITGKTARVVTGVGSIVLVVMVARVGHSGGELVYKHGAASAYVSPSGRATGAAAGDLPSRRATDSVCARRGDGDKR